MHIAFYDLIRDLAALYYTMCVFYLPFAQYVLNNQSVKDIIHILFLKVLNDRIKKMENNF
jgi:hypothetical protein